MNLVCIINNKLKFFNESSIPSSLIWPNFECDEKKLICLKFINRAKLLRNTIKCFSQSVVGADLLLLENYSLVCCSIVIELSKLRVKKHCDPHKIVVNINRFNIVSDLFDRLLWRMAKKFEKEASKRFVEMIKNRHR